MIDFLNINKGESGLSVRGKLNNMLRAIIDGTDGVNAAWEYLLQLANTIDEFKEANGEEHEVLKQELLINHDYTDLVANNLYSYISIMEAGITGFAQDTSYNPQIPTEKSASVMAMGSGTYSHFLDSNGQPITITSPQSITIFYKPAGVDYWQYKTLDLEVVVDENVDGGNAYTKYGGAKIIDGGNAYHT